MEMIGSAMEEATRAEGLSWRLLLIHVNSLHEFLRSLPVELVTYA